MGFVANNRSIKMFWYEDDRFQPPSLQYILIPDILMYSRKEGRVVLATLCGDVHSLNEKQFESVKAAMESLLDVE